MTFTFPNSELHTYMKRPDGSYLEVLLKLRYGALLLCKNRDEREFLALQNTKLQYDDTNSRQLMIRFRNGHRPHLTLLFSCETEQKRWSEMLSKCATWSIEDFYKLGDELGRGAYGVVTSAKSITDHKQVAIKTSTNERTPNTRELDIMTSIDHANVLSVVDVLQTLSITYLVLPLMSGDLTSMVIREENRDIKTIRDIMRQLLCGLVELHENLVIHRDLKSDNILTLIDEYGHVTCKIADLGLATQLPSHDKFVNDGVFYGTPAYSSPEMLEEQPYGTKSDVFSMGCIFFQLLTGKLPFEGDDSSRIINCSEWEEVKNESVGFLVLEMLRYDAHYRISAVEALEHEWFSSD